MEVDLYAVPSDQELNDVVRTHDCFEFEPHPSDAVYAHVLDDLIEEDLTEAGARSLTTRRKLATRMRSMSSKLTRMRAAKRMRLAPTERLQYRARKAAIMLLRARLAGKRGRDYSKLSPSDRVMIDKQVVNRYGKNLEKMVKAIATRLLPMVRRKEADRLRVAKMQEGHQYYTGLSTSTKSARAAQFAKQTKMSDSDPSAYKKAPGDDKETRMSKHTKKYRDMFEARKSAHGAGDADEPSDNIVYQMRKVINLRGKHPVKFADGSTMQLHPDHAHHVIRMYHAQQRPLDKHKFVRHMGASSTNFKKAIGLSDQFAIDKDLPVSSDPREFPVRSSYITSSKKAVREEIGYRVTGRATAFVPQNAPEYPPTSHAVPSDLPEKKGDKKTLIDRLVAKARSTKNEDISDVLHRERDALKQKQHRERDALAHRHAAKVKVAAMHKKTIAKSRSSSYLKSEEYDYAISESALAGLQKKAEKSGIPLGVLRKVYNRGMAAWKTGHRPGANQQQWAYARVNSFITKGKGTWGGADKDLAASVRKEEIEVSEATISRRQHTVGKPASSYKPIQSTSSGVMNFKGVDWKAAADSVRDEIRKEKEAKLAKLKKTVSESAGVGSDELRDEYASATPGQNPGGIDVSHVSAPKPWEVDEQMHKSRDIGKSVRTWEDVRKVLSGRKNVNESFVAGIGDAPFAREVGLSIGGQTFKHHDSMVAEADRSEKMDDDDYDHDGCKDCDCVEEGLEGYRDVSETTITHKGHAVKLGAVTKSDRPDKKRMVHVRNDKGNVVRVHFGDPNLEIKRDNPERRRNFRARHGCDNPGPRWKAKYWSCRYWSKKPVSKM